LAKGVYGPALDSDLLDRGFLCDAIGIILVWTVTQYFVDKCSFIRQSSKCFLLLTAYFSIVALFFGGELDRRDQEARFGKSQFDPLRKVSFLKIPLVILGGFLAVLG
jgi:hypothetical protein